METNETPLDPPLHIPQVIESNTSDDISNFIKGHNMQISSNFNIIWLVSVETLCTGTVLLHPVSENLMNLTNASKN